MVDILLATYNGAAYLEEQLNSILNQSYMNWHLIVRDDCSDDETQKILQSYVIKYPDKITVYINENPSGSAKNNFIKLLRDVKHEYVMFCDQDDIWDKDKIEQTLCHMWQLERDVETGSPIPILVATDLRVVTSEGEIIADSFLEYMNLPIKVTLNRLLIQNNITGCTVLINRTLCEMLKKVRDVDAILMHDHFAALTAVVFGKAAILNKSTISYRQHGNNLVGAIDARSISYMWKRFKRGRMKFREDMADSATQSKYFLKLYEEYMEDKNPEKKILLEYSQLTKKNKIRKIFFFGRYNVFKYGWIRKIVQIIWC